MMEIARGTPWCMNLGSMGAKIHSSIREQLGMLITINRYTRSQGDFEKIRKRWEELKNFKEGDISRIATLICQNQFKYTTKDGEEDLAANLAFIFSRDSLRDFSDPIVDILRAATGEKIDITKGGVYKAGAATMFNQSVARIFGAPRTFADFGINADLARVWAIVEYVKDGKDDDGGTIRSCLDSISAINVYITEKIGAFLEERENAWLTAAVRQDLINLKDRLYNYRRNVIGVMKNIHLSPDLGLGEVIPFLETIDGVKSICDYQTASRISSWKYDERSIWLLLAAATGMDFTIKTASQTHTSFGECLNRVTINLGPISVYEWNRYPGTMLLHEADAYHVLSNYLTATEPEECEDV